MGVLRHAAATIEATMARRPHPAMVLIATVAIAGCGTRVRSELHALSSTTTVPRTTVPASTTTIDAAAATAQITKNWETFFNAATPLVQREALLEDGTTYEQALTAASKNQFYAQASATVSEVQLTSPTQASVTYDILVGGNPALKGSTGTAVFQGTVWKVSGQTFCGLVSAIGQDQKFPGCS